MNPESIHHVLGRQVAYPDRYSPDILVRVDRAGNRMAHHIDEVHLPFTGLDLWNAYEVSALTDAVHRSISSCDCSTLAKAAISSKANR